MFPLTYLHSIIVLIKFVPMIYDEAIKVFTFHYSTNQINVDTVYRITKAKFTFHYSTNQIKAFYKIHIPIFSIYIPL